MLTDWTDTTACLQRKLARTENNKVAKLVSYPNTNTPFRQQRLNAYTDDWDTCLQ